MTRGVLGTLAIGLVTGMTATCTMAADLPQEAMAKLAPNMVRVQYWLQYHNGEEPSAPGWLERCPNCGGYHSNSAATAVSEERPAELPGILLSPTTVLLSDPLVHPRFIREIKVRRGDTERTATVSAYGAEQSGLMLTLAEAMPDTPELNFETGRTGPFFAVTYRERWGMWTLQSAAMSQSPALLDDGRAVVGAPAPSLIVDAQGRPVSAAVQVDLPADGWKIPPQTWNWITAEQMQQRMELAERMAEASIVRVTLNFRSPPASRSTRMSMYGRDEQSMTEQHVLGVVMENNRLLVLKELNPGTTARLERIRIHTGAGNEIPAKFVASLSDYGAFLADAEGNLPGIPLSEQDIASNRNRLLPSVLVNVAGDKRVSWAGHTRFHDVEVSWHQQLVPETRKLADRMFAFDADNRLLVLPVSRRDRGVNSTRSWRRDPQPKTTALAYLSPVMRDLPAHADASNVPLSEEEEGRIAWLGVEVQALSEELAREAGISDQFEDDRSGALVAYVYPDSPAAQQGIEPGMVLLRLRVPGQSQPIPVQAEDDRFGRHGAFPWEQLDGIPAEYLDQIPQPWPTAASQINQTLTDIGLGKTVVVELFHDGQTMEKTFTLEEGPRHYDTAARHKHDGLGITVRELTYETRRFFRRPAGEPGLVVSKVVSGARAATAGVRPYEIITHVNDVPVSTIAEWEKALEGQSDLKLSVRRMARGRVVKVSLPQPGDAPAAPEEETLFP